MKEIKSIKALHIVSEPGDATRYSYMVTKDGPDIYCFSPLDNDFNYPQKINKWEVLEAKEITEPIVVYYSDKYNCNVYTVMECIRTVQELENWLVENHQPKESNVEKLELFFLQVQDYIGCPDCSDSEKVKSIELLIAEEILACSSDR